MRFVLLALLTLVGSGATAQTPAATVATGSLSGLVRDGVGNPLADVSVTLQGESLSTRTDSAGHFVLADVPVGGHTALFRRIGYRSVEYRWLAELRRGLQVAVVMTPVPRTLERVVVEAPGTSKRHGTSSIAGAVNDSAGHHVVGADVRLLGAGLSTITDSSGAFAFQQLAAGSYIVRARHVGLASGNYAMQIAGDDSRGISLTLYGLPKKTGARDTAVASGYGVADVGFDAFDRRARTGYRYPTLGPADLFRQNHAPLEVVLQQYREDPTGRQLKLSSIDDAKRSLQDGDCLIVDGKLATYQPLRTFTSGEVQMIEVFRRNSFVDDYIVSQMDGVRECRGSMDRHPPYFVLWTRRLH